MMKTEKDKILIREFLDLVDNDKYRLEKYSRPILVYQLSGNTVNYSLWEEDLLNRFGIENVDGWDFQTDVIFCPDWVSGEDVFFDDDDDDDF